MVSCGSGAFRGTYALRIGFVVTFLVGAPAAMVGQTGEVPTHMVEVDGDSTRVAVLGIERHLPGEPVLVVWAGGGVTIEGWRGWLEEASALAPVVTWDRIGIGGTPFNGLSPTPARVVEHAHELMSTLEIPPPYVMVGHSFGAVHMIYYAGAYPEEVVGMVYLDPTNFRVEPYEWAMASNEEEYRAFWAEWEEELASEELTPGELAQLRASDVFLQAPVRDRGIPPDPDVPTAVLVGGKSQWSDDEEIQAEHSRRRQSSMLAWISGIPHSLFLLATEARHFVHFDDPELALEAVRWVLSRAGSER